MANELPLPYVPIDPNIESHPKTRRFIRAIGRVGDPFAHMHVVAFLLSAGRHHPDGHLGMLEDEDLADMALWTGDATAFAGALSASGWIDKDRDGYFVRGWEDYGGQVYAKRVAFRERQAKNGSKGGRPRKPYETQKNPTETQKNPKKPNSQNDAVGTKPDRSQHHDEPHFEGLGADFTSNNSGEITTEKNPEKPKPNPEKLKVKGEGEDLLLLLGIEGDSLERTVTREQLNNTLTARWGWSIQPKWQPQYGELQPFSPAEIRAARESVTRKCSEEGGRPNPGLLLRKLQDGRKPGRPAHQGTRTASPPAPDLKAPNKFAHLLIPTKRGPV